MKFLDYLPVDVSLQMTRVHHYLNGLFNLWCSINSTKIKIANVIYTHIKIVHTIRYMQNLYIHYLIWMPFNKTINHKMHVHFATSGNANTY